MAVAVSAVALSENAEVCIADIQSELAAKWPDLPPSTNTDEKGDALCFRVGSADVIVAKMPAPIPWSDLEGPCATSILWPDAASILKQHEVHVIVTVLGKLEPVPLSTLLTQATAAVLRTCPAALGVYWGNATLLIRKDIFIDFAINILPQGPPLDIWIDYNE